ncbi:MAG: pectate lyase [Bacillota bacterium]
MRGSRPLALLIATVVLGIGHTSFARSTAEGYLKRPDDWYRTPEAACVAANILSYQSPLGGWPKNTDTTSSPYPGDPAKLSPTFDNGATTDELRFLAKAYQVTHEDRYQQAFLKGLDYILKAQYPSGGWPQFYPPSQQYHRHITFNDRTIVRLMELLREVAGSDSYSFVDSRRRVAAREAFDRGVQCILKCQIKVNGKLTAWCAQHDENDYVPRSGRAYELVSVSGAESVDIVRLLMSLENPSPEVVHAIDAAVAWFESAKLQGIKVVDKGDPKAPKGKDKVVVEDPAAAPMWARFYEIGSNRPIFCDRDGVPKHNLAEIGYERRNGYAWLGYWPQELLAKDYPAWKARIVSEARTSPRSLDR